MCKWSIVKLKHKRTCT